MKKIKVAVIGPGNIGSDLMYKILRSENLEMVLMAGIVESEGIIRAKSLGVETTIEGIDGVLAHQDIQIVFDATSAAAHLKHAPLLAAHNMIAIDLTPAAIGPYMVPSVNLEELLNQNLTNINLVTCGGQATIPIVHAIERVAGASYAEIVACISSKSAGPGTRANIDEFTQTTTKAIEMVGGADKGKAIIILNPADPPVMMSNTVYVTIKNTEVSIESIVKSIDDIVQEIKHYVPGYNIRVPATKQGNKVSVGIEVAGQGDFLPEYSGNLDIINAAAIAAAQRIARKLQKEERR